VRKQFLTLHAGSKAGWIRITLRITLIHRIIFSFIFLLPPPYFLLSPTPTLLPLFPFPSFIAIRFHPSRFPTLIPFCFFLPSLPFPNEQAAGGLQFLFYFKVCLVVCFLFPKFSNFRHLVNFLKVGNFGDFFLRV